MNIEEERKAFEDHAMINGLELVRTNVALRFANGTRLSVGDYFEPTKTAFTTWLAAKAHAEEMAKPVVRYYMLKQMVVLVKTNNDSVCDTLFESVEAAKVWAQKNGYRVVDE